MPLQGYLQAADTISQAPGRLLLFATFSSSLGCQECVAGAP